MSSLTPPAQCHPLGVIRPNRMTLINFPTSYPSSSPSKLLPSAEGAYVFPDKCICDLLCSEALSSILRVLPLHNLQRAVPHGSQCTEATCNLRWHRAATSVPKASHYTRLLGSREGYMGLTFCTPDGLGSNMIIYSDTTWTLMQRNARAW